MQPGDRQSIQQAQEHLLSLRPFSLRPLPLLRVAPTPLPSCCCRPSCAANPAEMILWGFWVTFSGASAFQSFFPGRKALLRSDRGTRPPSKPAGSTKSARRNRARTETWRTQDPNPAGFWRVPSGTWYHMVVVPKMYHGTYGNDRYHHHPWVREPDIEVPMYLPGLYGTIPYDTIWWNDMYVYLVCTHGIVCGLRRA